MAFLGRGKKQDLLILAVELGLTVSAETTVVDLRKGITGSADYDEEYLKIRLDTILSERKEEEEFERAERLKEKELQRQHDLKEKELQRQHDLKKKKKEIQRQQDLKEKALQLKFELEKIKLRAQTKQIQRESERVETKDQKSETAGKVTESNEDEASICGSTDTEEQSSIPALQTDAPELDLFKVDREGFIKAQGNSQDLKELFDQTAKQDPTTVGKTYSIINGLLVKNREGCLSDVVQLLEKPEGLREQVEGDEASICVSTDTEEQISIPALQTDVSELDLLKVGREGFLNAQRKSQDLKESVDQTVKQDPANVGKTYSIINGLLVKNREDCLSDVVQLLEIPEGLREQVEALDMSCKYPEAIPVVDINSVMITDALLNIFSWTGFSCEIRCDQGTSFTCALTIEIFARFGIKVRHSSGHHPQGNSIEGSRRTLKRLYHRASVRKKKKHLNADSLSRSSE